MKENLKLFKKRVYAILSKYNASLSDKERKKVDALINMAYVFGGKNKREEFLRLLEQNLSKFEKQDGDVYEEAN